MKKIIIVMLILVINGCAEKNEYEATVSEQMKADKDIKDYKIAPEKMTDCVVKSTSENMPGVFPLDPDRLMAYKNYTKMLKLNDSSDPKKTLEELRKEFGSAKALADAHANYAESLVSCMSDMVSSTEERNDNKKN